MDTLWARVGKHLSGHLDETETTNLHFGEDIGVSRETVRQWRNGKRIPARHVLAVANLARFPLSLRHETIAAAIGIEIDDLVKALGLDRYDAVVRCAQATVNGHRADLLDESMYGIEELGAALDALAA